MFILCHDTLIHILYLHQPQIYSKTNEHSMPKISAPWKLARSSFNNHRSSPFVKLEVNQCMGIPNLFSEMICNVAERS